MMVDNSHINGDSNADILLVHEGVDGTGTRQGLLSSGRGVGFIT